MLDAIVITRVFMLHVIAALTMLMLSPTPRLRVVTLSLFRAIAISLTMPLLLLLLRCYAARGAIDASAIAAMLCALLIYY